MILCFLNGFPLKGLMISLVSGLSWGTHKGPEIIRTFSYFWVIFRQYISKRFQKSPLLSKSCEKKTQICDCMDFSVNANKPAVRCWTSRMCRPSPPGCTCCSPQEPCGLGTSPNPRSLRSRHERGRAASDRDGTCSFCGWRWCVELVLLDLLEKGAFL